MAYDCPMHGARAVTAKRSVAHVVGLALLVLLLAQWLALAHSIQHAGPAASAVAAAADDGRWGHDANTPSCELIGHLLTSELTGGEAPVTAGVPPATWLAPRPGHCPVGGAPRSAYQARGPPRG